MVQRDKISGRATDSGLSRGSNSDDCQESNRAGSVGGPDRYQVTFALPWIVHGVDTGQDAINIAVSEIGKRVTSATPHTQGIDISVQEIECTGCDASTDALLLVSGTALVGLFLQAEVEARSPEKAEKIARREIGSKLHNTPLTSINVGSLG